MNKNGFTLIELLAVIVILSIIALIATPIILGIINDAKEESNKRSIDLYADSIKKAIITKEMKDLKGIVPGAYNSEELKTKLDVSVEYEGNRVECDTVELYEDGRVYIANCKVNDEAIEYTYGEQQEILAEFDKVCSPSTELKSGNTPTGEYKPGDEYLCEVKPGELYRFYVLSKEGNKVNLILESNIRKDGTLIKENNGGEGQVYSWMSSTYKNLFLELGGTEEEWNNDNAARYKYGPIGVIIFLNQATSTWTNLGSLIIKEYEYCNQTQTVEGIDEYSMRPMGKTYISNARLPYDSELTDVGCTTEVDSCPEWASDYMDYPSTTRYKKITIINGVECYWTATATVSGGIYMKSKSDPFLSPGVRPVISLQI